MKYASYGCPQDNDHIYLYIMVTITVTVWLRTFPGFSSDCPTDKGNFYYINVCRTAPEKSVKPLVQIAEEFYASSDINLDCPRTVLRTKKKNAGCISAFTMIYYRKRETSAPNRCLPDELIDGLPVPVNDQK